MSTVFLLPLGVALLGFWALWPVSIVRKDASIVDFWWAPGFAALAWAGWAMSDVALAGTSLLLLALVTAWGLRLGATLATRRLREGVEDPRYAEMRAAREPGFWWKSFFIVFTLQAIIQWIIATGLIAAVAAGAAPGPLAAFGALLAICGAGIEARSDFELDRFKRTEPHGGLLTTGLRAHVRYPSYAGEILFWVGLSTVAFDAGIWWAPLNAALVAALLLYLSGIPILEDRFTRTRPDFAAYRNRVPALIPRIGRGATGGVRQ
ncbi:MAG: DUF1295 domain-containing protein [Pseudomonadota bacterium]